MAKQFLHNKWMEIDADAVKGNLEAIQTLLEERTRLVAVLKADAYGHGAVNIARLLFQQGVDFFAVSFLGEAIELRKAGIRASILVFSPLIDEDQVKEAMRYKLTLTITSLYDSQLIDEVSQRLNQKVSVHLKVETGLARFGLNGEELIAVCNSLKDNSNIYIEGIYTHMAEAAANNASYTEGQFARFMELCQSVTAAGFKIPVKHCANSAVFLKYPHMHLDAVRIGTLLSGQYPSGNFDKTLTLTDPFKFKSQIIAIQNRKAGTYLGYYRSYRLKNPAQIAVIPVGYNDGLALEVANKPEGFIDLCKKLVKMILFYFDSPRFSLYVKIKGRAYPVRGKVFMQMALIEIPLNANVNVGDEVEIPIRKTLAAKSITRFYLKDGAAVKIEDEEGTSYVVEEE
ncbi:MAG: alanine racemase [Syntrophomonas sp.]